MIAQIAPRPELFLSGLQDTRHFPLDGIRSIGERNQSFAGFRSVRFDGGHTFREGEKATACVWLKAQPGVDVR